jgi:hypothetical protein
MLSHFEGWERLGVWSSPLDSRGPTERKGKANNATNCVQQEATAAAAAESGPEVSQESNDAKYVR